MDDEEPFLEVTTHFLRKLGGFEVHGVTSVPRALEAMERESFDAVISDYQMPDMNGIELLKALRSKGSEVPFILLTGRGREDVAIEALNQGADFYLQKGKDLRTQFHELANMVTQAVTSKRSYLELIASQGRFKELADRVTDIFIGLTPDLKITYWNKAIEDFMGIASRDAVGKRLMSIVPELVGTRTEELIRRAQETGKRHVSVMEAEVGGKEEVAGG